MGEAYAARMILPMSSEAGRIWVGEVGVLGRGLVSMRVMGAEGWVLRHARAVERPNVPEPIMARLWEGDMDLGGLQVAMEEV